MTYNGGRKQGRRSRRGAEGPAVFRLPDGDEISIPKAIVEINSDCNFACPGCYMLQNGKHVCQERMAPADVAAIISILRPRRIDILGGEPLLSPHFRPIVELCLVAGVEVWVYSNLSLIDAGTADFLARRQVAVTGKLNIGDPGDEEQLYLQSQLIGRDRKAVHSMLRGIETMTGAGYRRPLFRLENLVRRQNIHLAPDFLRWCFEREIDPDLELPACSDSTSERTFLKDISPGPDQIREAVPGLKRVCEEFGREGPALPPHMVGAGICTFKCEGMYFRKEGDAIAMQPCSSNATHLGFLDGRESVVTALEMPVMKVRRSLDDLYLAGAIEGPCGQCEDFVASCRGGCRATAENLRGLQASYPLCWRRERSPDGT